MDLRTEYLGLMLPHPLVAGASPLSDDLDGVKRLEDAGAAAIVLRSLFEEQITREQMSEYINLDSHGESFAEAASYFPSPHAFQMGPFEYLEHLRLAKKAVRIPVMASLNGSTPGGWIEYARLMVQAGADALELKLIASRPVGGSVGGVHRRRVRLAGGRAAVGAGGVARRRAGVRRRVSDPAGRVAGVSRHRR